MSDTPLSDAISLLRSDASSTAFAVFIETFRRSTVGMIAITLPADRQPGETFQAGPGDVTLSIVSTPDGRRMVKACADPATFAVRYPTAQITALMLGQDVLEILDGASDIEGVLVCSATSFHSVPITRSEASGLSTVPIEKVVRPRWKFWKS